MAARGGMRSAAERGEEIEREDVRKTGISR